MEHYLVRLFLSHFSYLSSRKFSLCFTIRHIGCLKIMLHAIQSSAQLSYHISLSLCHTSFVARGFIIVSSSSCPNSLHFKSFFFCLHPCISQSLTAYYIDFHSDLSSSSTVHLLFSCLTLHLIIDHPLEPALLSVRYITLFLDIFLLFLFFLASVLSV